MPRVRQALPDLRPERTRMTDTHDPQPPPWPKDAGPTPPAAANASSKPSTTPSNDGEEISVSGIARRAGVDRSFLYRHRDLLEHVHAAEAQPPNAPASGPPSAGHRCKPT